MSVGLSYVYQRQYIDPFLVPAYIVGCGLRCAAAGLMILDNAKFVCVCVYIYIQGVTGGTDQTSGECSLGQTIPI